jgi:hypothetical protein
MSTVREIIERAHRKIGVKARDEPLTSDDLSEGLEALNAMMHGWRMWGVDVAHSDMDANRIFPLPPEFEEGTIYQLASRLAPDFSAPGIDASDFLRALQAYVMTIQPAQVDGALTRMPSQRRTF